MKMLIFACAAATLVAAVSTADARDREWHYPRFDYRETGGRPSRSTEYRHSEHSGESYSRSRHEWRLR